MTVLARLLRGALVALLLAGASGCLPSGRTDMDEEKESHFMAGRTCVNNRDYPGAVDEFRRALRANPDSGAAHFQLGWLYEEKVSDPAAAIYHYERYLELRPGADNAEVIKQHIENCKQDLAKTVLPLPITPGMQHEFEQLAAENKRLREELEKWKAYAGRAQIPTNVPGPGTPVRGGSSALQISSNAATNGPGVAAGLPRATSGRTYAVQAGDTPFSIAKKNGVKLEALLGANPGIDARRLKVGQVLNVPPP